MKTTFDAPKFSVMLNDAVNNPGTLSKCYSAFHNYSFHNQLLAMFQCCERGLSLGPISTFNGWREKGYVVKKGQKALSLWMPWTKRTKNEETGEESFKRLFFVKNLWFVFGQVQPLEGEKQKDISAKISEWDKETALRILGISEKPFEMLSGNCQGYAIGNSIAINPLAEFPHKTTFHEMAHVQLGHTKDGKKIVDGEVLDRNIMEVEAETTAYCLTSLFDLPGQEESRGYIQHWIKGKEIPEENAKRIFKVVNQIMDAGREKKNAL